MTCNPWRSALWRSLVIDASYDNNDQLVPYLNTWAWHADPIALLDAMQQASANDDLGFLYDVMQELGNSCFEIKLSDYFPAWPDDSPAAEAKLKQDLVTACREANVKQVVYLHHVDCPPLIKIAG